MSQQARRTIKASVRKRLIALAAFTVAAALAIAGIVARSAFANQNVPEGARVVKVGVYVSSFNDVWDAVNQELAARGDNVRVQTVQLGGDELNTALASHEIDLNAAPHYAYFNWETKAKNLDLEPFAETVIQRIYAYSDKIGSLDDLKDGDTVAIPADNTNQGRALKVLESAGVLTTDPSKGYLPTVNDITSNPKRIKFAQADTTALPRLLPDVAAAVILTPAALDAGLDPAKDSIYTVPVNPDDIYNQPWINIIAGRKGEGNDPAYRKVIEAYGSQRVRQAIATGHAVDAVEVFKDLKA